MAVPATTCQSEASDRGAGQAGDGPPPNKGRDNGADSGQRHEPDRDDGGKRHEAGIGQRIEQVVAQAVYASRRLSEGEKAFLSHYFA